ERPYHVLFMGCSYTYGDSVRDSETYVWKLNELLPNVLCDNGGVRGYGPYRSYIRMQRLLKKRKYDLVVYAMIDNHSGRCTIPSSRAFVCTYSGSDHPVSNLYAMPFTALASDFRFVDHPLHRYAFPADGISTTSNFLNHLFTAFTIRHQEIPAKNKQIVIFADIIGRMAQLAAAFDSKFMLLSLDGDDRPDELIGCREIYPNWITVHQNQYLRALQSEDRIGHKYANHPNAAVHSYWAQHLAAYLQQDEVFSSLIAYRQFRRDNRRRSLYDLYKSEDNNGI
ncbi:hypothetical protein IJT17_10725, partial [bacterium]|nr:hypothetical protein [bacterium]